MTYLSKDLKLGRKSISKLLILHSINLCLIKDKAIILNSCKYLFCFPSIIIFVNIVKVQTIELQFLLLTFINAFSKSLKGELL